MVHSVGGGVILFSQDPDSTITIHGRLAFSKGCTFAVGKGGNAEFGRNVVFNSGCLLVVSSSTSFGDDCHIGWNCTFLDDDGHSVNRKPTKGEIRIGNHVWIAAEASILKNVIIGDNVVVGYGSLLSNQNVPSNTLVSGPKGIQRAENITWAI